MSTAQVTGLFKHNGTVKVVSVAVAIVLWSVVLGSRNVEVVKEVPIEVVFPPDLTAAQDLPDRIGFRLAGPKAFLRAILDRREEPIRVNLSGYKAGLVNYKFFEDNIRLPLGVKVMGVSPGSLVLRLEPIRSREVPVRLELRGTTPDGVHLSSAILEPPVVRIRGAESRVETINEISTLPLDLTDVTQSAERSIGLDLARLGVTIEGKLPIVRLSAESITGGHRVRNVDIRVLSSYKSKLEDKAVTVFVKSTGADLKQLDPAQVFAVVDLRGRPKGRYVEAVKVTLPDGVGLVRVVPERVAIRLE